MSRPGTTITRSATRPAQSPRTATGPWFVTGPTGTVDTLGAGGVRKPCVSLTDYATRFGSRSSHVNDGGGGAAALFDAADQYFRDGGSELFVSPATYHATAGTYETNIATALALFTNDLGPGQVSHPGRTTAATRVALAAHAESHNRIAIAATTNTGTPATLISEATVAGITTSQERYLALFGPNITIPGVSSGTRTLDPTAAVAAAMARNDAAAITPNQPSAGIYGISPTALDTTFSFSDDDRATLSLNGVNLMRDMFDGVRVYGYRTLADPSTDPDWVNLANARLFMAITAVFDKVAERYVFRQLDGQRKTVNEFGGDLTAELIPFWEKGSLFGEVPSQAFSVDVGANINTDESMAAGYLKANVGLRMSQFAEEVSLELVKVRTTEEV